MMTCLKKNRLIRLPEVLEMVGCARTSIYVWQKTAGFPQPVRIGARAVAWRESDLLEWLENRPKAGR